MGSVLGAVTMVSSIGMAAGPLVGGWIYDTTHGYNWLYIGSCAVAFGAAGIALAFPPQPSRQRRHLQAA